MRKNIEPLSWQTDLAAFGKRNNLRPTRLEVLGPARELESDFWLEDGLLLSGIDVDVDGELVFCGDHAPGANAPNQEPHDPHHSRREAIGIGNDRWPRRSPGKRMQKVNPDLAL